MTTWAPHFGTSHWSRTEAPGGTKEPGSPRPTIEETVATKVSPRPVTHIYIRHRAFSGEACQFLFIPWWSWYTCMRLLSTGPWDPWVWGACSGSVLALRLVMEVVVLGTPHPCSQFSRCYPLLPGSPEKW